jgi:hypothetical protein
MRNYVLIFSLLLLFSDSWGFDSKSKTRKEPVSKINTSTASTASGALGKPANESSLRLGLRATSYESQFTKLDVLQLKLNYNLKYYVNPSIYLKLNPIARLHSGAVQSVDGAESLENRLSIQHAAAYYQWMKESYVAAGIFDQYEVFSLLLVDDQMAFMGGQAKQSISNGPWTFGVQGQTAIPNSRSAISDQNEKDSSPMLNSVGLTSSWETGDKNVVQAKANYFKFSQLPTSISTASVVAGNTPADTRISDTERAFKYEYQGLDTDLSFKRRVYKGAYLLGAGSFLENQGAPKGLNQAYRTGGGAGYTVLGTHDIELSGYTYRIESDATVGAYANTDYFATNHMGYEFIASWKNVKQNFRISFYFSDAKLIVENPAQSDEKMYFLRFEVLNVAL